MAKAEKTYVEPTYVLSLSSDEAHFLRDIFDHIGGCADTSRRRHSNAIRRALQDVGVYASGAEDIRENSAIYFE